MIFPRSTIIETIITAAKNSNSILALWESGAAAFGRIDECSDIDLSAVVRPGHVEQSVQLIKEAISLIADIDREFHQRTYHGDAQYYWQFSKFNPFNFVDMDFIEQRAEPVRIAPSIHNMPIIHFDKSNCIELAEETPEERKARIKASVESIEAMYLLHPTLVRKHLKRGHVLHAYGEYQRFMVRPLVELLRLKYCPQRSSFFTTYIQYDLPADVNERLLSIVMVSDPHQMEENLHIVQNWIGDLLAELKQPTNRQ